MTQRPVKKKEATVCLPLSAGAAGLERAAGAAVLVRPTPDALLPVLHRALRLQDNPDMEIN